MKVQEESFLEVPQTEQTRSKSMIIVLLQNEVSYSQEVQGIVSDWERNL